MHYLSPLKGPYDFNIYSDKSRFKSGSNSGPEPTENKSFITSAIQSCSESDLIKHYRAISILKKEHMRTQVQYCILYIFATKFLNGIYTHLSKPVFESYNIIIGLFNHKNNDFH